MEGKLLKLLHVIPSVDPSGGGPIEAVNQLCRTYRDSGVVVEICSIDRPNDVFVANSKTKVHALGPGHGKYAYSSRLVPWLRTHAHEFDAVIVNGLWQYTSFAVWRALAGTSTPYFIFVHGMLGPWFKRAYPIKHLKKWLYWPWGEYRVLRDARRVIFTCETERLAARQCFSLYKANEAVTVYGVNDPPPNIDELGSRFATQYPRLKDKRIVLFLGRLHEVKGCDLLIAAFAQVAKQDENLHLVMAGPGQSRWVTKLKAQSDALGIAHRITWPGMLQNDAKWGALQASEVLCLPSHHENFGIVVAEALACGKPVMISDKVNIWREIREAEAGFVDADTTDGTVRNLQRWQQLDANGYMKMSDRARQCFAIHFHVRLAGARLLEIIGEAS